MCMKCGHKKYAIKWRGNHASITDKSGYVGSVEMGYSGCRVYVMVGDYLNMRIVMLWDNKADLNHSIRNCVEDMVKA